MLLHENMIVDGLALVTVEIAVNAILFGILFGAVLSTLSHIINMWDV